VILKAKGAAAPAINIASADFTVDVNGDPVSPVSSSASITLMAARISGHVYEDVDQSGSISGGDEALASITISLYTDPNGDGNPADGILVGITSTDVNGGYEFLNLPTGDYVIVESQPPGYSSSADTSGANDNRIPVQVSTLTTYAGNTFFDFLTPPLSYSSIAGKVWNDVDASAAVNGGEAGLENVPVNLVEDTNGNGIAEPGEPIVNSTLTDADGSYSFGGLNAGNYVVVELDRFGWYSTADVSAPNDNMISVVLAVATDITGRDFLDVLTGSTGGKVFHDVNGSGSYEVGADMSLPNVDVILTDSLGNAQTVITDGDGNWSAKVPPGNTSVNVDQNDPQFIAAFPTGHAQTAGTDPTSITIVSGVNTPAGDDGFLQLGSISGSVLADTGNDDDGDEPIPGVTLTLKDSLGNDIDSNPSLPDIQPTTTISNGSGIYSFGNLLPGTYRVVESDPVGYLSISANTISPVIVTAGATTGGIDFIDEQVGTIGNLIWHDANNDGLNSPGELGIDGIFIELMDGANSVVRSVNTAGGGFYSFSNIAPGSYRLRISTPPVLYPLSSTTTDMTDNDEDGDDNGMQSTPTAVTLSPLITLAAGQVKSTLDFGFTELTGTRSIRGEVRDDYDLDSNFSDHDQAVPNVAVRLYADSNGNGIFDSGTDTLIRSTSTNILGEYSFADLPDGSYFVQEVDPAGATSTGDTQGSNDNLIPVTLAGADSTGNDFLDAVDPAGYIYSPVDGRIISGGSISVSGPGMVTILQDGSNGQYSFITDGTPGIYTLTYMPPAGYQIDPTRPVAGMNFDPTGLPSPHAMGSAESPLSPGYLNDFSFGGNPYYRTFDLASGDPLVINNNLPLVQTKPTTFAGWQYANPLGGQNGASQDPDGDGVTNLEEFAFCFSPTSGINGGCSLEIVRNGDGTLDALMRRVIGALGISYQLESLADLSLSGPNGSGWTVVSTIIPTVTSNGDGTETARYANLATLPSLSGGQGFVRVKVTLTSDGTIARGETYGWATRSLSTACQSCSQPFLKCAVFTGSVDSVIGSVLSVVQSVGTGDLAAQLTAGRQYYVEVLAGDHEGQRFEINETTSTQSGIAIDTASPRNTLGPILPTTLAGDRVVVREHFRISELFVPSTFTSTLDPSTADRLLFHNRNTAAFETYWLFSHPLSGQPRWVDVDDAALLDAGNRVLNVAEGFFVHPKGANVSLVFTGQVRSNDMACPLVVGANLTGNGWPLDMSPASRKILISDGFIGSRSSLAADRIQLWNTDENASAQGYTGYFLLNAGAIQRWVGQADASVQNQDGSNIFKRLRAQFIQPRTVRPSHLILNPWTP
jgi:large repetitive protein